MPEELVLGTDDDSLPPVGTPGPEAKAKALKEQRENLLLGYGQERTFVALVAVHKEAARNSLTKISCKKGVPIGGYVYDATTDTYSVLCVDYMLLGYVPVSMVLRVQGQDSFQVRLPVAEPVLRRYMTPAQKKDVRTFRAVYKSDHHYLQFIQMVDCSG